MADWQDRIIVFLGHGDRSDGIDKQAAELRRAIGALSQRFKSSEAAVGSGKLLNPLDMQVLLFVADHPASKATEVASHLVVAATTISSATDRLTRQGFLSREWPEENRRAISLSLTAAGQAYVSARLRVQTDHCRTILEKLSPEERHLFVRLFARIAQTEYSTIRKSYYILYARPWARAPAKIGMSVERRLIAMLHSSFAPSITRRRPRLTTGSRMAVPTASTLGSCRALRPEICHRKGHFENCAIGVANETDFVAKLFPKAA